MSKPGNIKRLVISSISELATETVIKRPEVPECVKAAFRRTVGHMRCVEEMLWREVAARGTLDALGFLPEATAPYEGMDKVQFHRYKRDVESARHWILHQQKEAGAVFIMGGVDVEPIRRVVASLPPVKVPGVLNNKNGKKGVTNNAHRIAA